MHFPNCKIYLSKWKNAYVQIMKCISHVKLGGGWGTGRLIKYWFLMEVSSSPPSEHKRRHHPTAVKTSKTKTTKTQKKLRPKYFWWRWAAHHPQSINGGFIRQLSNIIKQQNIFVQTKICICPNYEIYFWWRWAAHHPQSINGGFTIGQLSTKTQNTKDYLFAKNWVTFW